jgi:hypothetical protein
MPIATNELGRDFLVVPESATVRQVRDRVADTGNRWIYIVVGLEDGRFVVLRLAELIRVLQTHSKTLFPEMLETPLGRVPDLLRPRAGDAVERSSMSTGQAKTLARKMPGKRLVVLAAGEVIGLLAFESRSASPQGDLNWLEQPLDVETHVGMRPEPALPESGTKGLSAGEAGPAEAVETEKRWINAELENHVLAEPLQMGQVYTLAFDVDTQLRETALAGAEFGYRFGAEEQWVVLTVQLSSDDFEIYTQPQQLRVPRSGRSKGKARFDIEPKHTGEGVINAIFLKDGNFIQLITLKLHTGAADQPAVPAAEALGRPLDAAFVVQARDLNVTILNTGAGFQIILSGPVGAMANLPLTLPELDQIIADVREELKAIVRLALGPQKMRVYQAGIDIPAQVNRAAMQRLARAGFRLYQRLFYGPAADSQANLLGDRLREMAHKERLKIQIFSQQFMLPWGVLYVADAYDPHSVEPELFLGLKHIIEHIPLQQNMRVIDDILASRPQFTVSLNVNADIDQQMNRPLIANQIVDWQHISHTSGTQVVVRKTRDDVLQALADGSTPDQILYFYCHAISKALGEGAGPDDSSLVLSGDGCVTLEDLNLLASPRQALSGSPLVFINACESAELSPLFYDGFVPYFMARGARGVIGTECEVPALFAAEWARRFFKHFLTGRSLGQVLLDLRREFYYQHNNLLGLLYALYCDGDTQIVPGLQL